LVSDDEQDCKKDASVTVNPTGVNRLVSE